MKVTLLCMSILSRRVSQVHTHMHMHIYTHTHTHTSISIYLYIYTNPKFKHKLSNASGGKEIFKKRKH